MTSRSTSARRQACPPPVRVRGVSTSPRCSTGGACTSRSALQLPHVAFKPRPQPLELRPVGIQPYTAQANTKFRCSPSTVCLRALQYACGMDGYLALRTVTANGASCQLGSVRVARTWRLIASLFVHCQ